MNKETPQIISQDEPSKPKLLATFAPFIALFPALGLLMLALQPSLLNLLLKDAGTPLELIQGYRVWYVLLFAFCGAGAALILASGWISIRKGVHSWKAIKLMLVAVLFQLFISGALLLTEKVPSLLLQSSADISQIKNSQLETEVVAFYQAIPAGLPGPSAAGQPKPFMRCAVLGESSGEQWRNFYVPNSLGAFENEASYEITYTENLRVVVSMKPVS